MKRYLALLLALLMLLGLLSGCGQQDAVLPDGAPVSQVQQDDAAADTSEPQEDPDEDASEPQEEPSPSAEDTGFSILFLDVGQADCMLVTCDGERMLVDGGNVPDSQLVASALRSRGIDYLDYIVCTHPHEDHAGGLPGALAACQVGTALAPTESADNVPFTNFVSHLAKQGVSVTVPEPDDTFALGSAAVQVLGPRQDYDEVNDTSLVLMVTYGSTRFLLTGDMERAAETDLVEAGCDLKADLLKVGHHGSSSSTSYRFLNEVMPTYGVIQVGEGNDYGHPTEEVLSRLRDADVELYRTDMQGDILAVSDGERIEITVAGNPNAETNPTIHDESGQNTTPVTYIGNVSSLKFHRTSCRSLPAEKNQISFASREDAVAAGYDPCGNCDP